MTEDSRKAFEAWCERTGHFSLANNDWAWIAWSARDADIAALKARVEEHEKVCAGVWVPVGERLPTDDDYVFIIADEEPTGIASYYADCGEWRHNGLLHGVTHWLDVRSKWVERPLSYQLE